MARRTAPHAGDEAGVRRAAGRLLGRDFSGVQVRTGAADLAAEGAGAETRGDEVRVAPGHWRPDLPLGRALLAHELAHVAQQDAAPRTISGPGPGGFGGALETARTERPSAALAARGARLGEPAAGLTPAPRGMRQRTLGGRRDRKAPAPAPAAPAPPAAGPEDWSFTPADYAALKAAGGDLSFAPGSEWLPGPVRENLLATLAKVLDPALVPTATEGVNVRDFYHGHIAIPLGSWPVGYDAPRTAYDEVYDSRLAAALGGKDYNPVTAENLPALGEALAAARPLAAGFLEPLIAVPGAAVIYHTFEHNTPPDMRSGDPRRNWVTPFASQTPMPYSPPDPDSSSSYEEDWNDLYQFAFLVDGQGRIHVQPGGTRQLSVVTGVPGK